MTNVDDKREVLAELVSLEEIAAMIGVQANTMHVYMRRARVNRDAGTPRPEDLPEPDLRTPRSPMWLRETVKDWIARR